MKFPLYARFGIPEVWIPNLAQDTIGRHAEPAGGGYGLIRTARRGGSLASTALPDITLAVDAVVP